MTQDIAEPVVPPCAEDGQKAEESIGETFARLYADGRAYADAELAKQKLRASILAGGIRDAAILAISALLLLFAAIIAFLVGLVIALPPALGPIGAAGAVLGGALLLTAILLMFAKSRIGRMNRTLRP